jgi:hypothetical protein
MCAQDYDLHYLRFFECFNEQRFFEAHDVLEALWLPQRGGPNGAFYKGLIQLAGAFVHWQKHRLGPAAALFKLARTYLQKYPASHEGLSVVGVVFMIDEWLSQLTATPPKDFPSGLVGMPRLRLETLGGGSGRRDGAE